MHRCRRKAVLNLNSSAAPNGTICYFLNWLIPFIAFAIFFSRSKLKEKTLRRTLTKTMLDHLARNNMARKVDHFNGVQCFSSTTNDPFPVLRKAKLPNDDREGGEGPKLGVIVRASYCYKLAIIYPIGHVWFGVRVNGGGKGRGKDPCLRRMLKSKTPPD